MQIATPRGGTCFGDSGGPTLLHDTDIQVAVTSWGFSPTCTGHSYEFRVDTAAVQEWMESVLQPLGLWDDIHLPPDRHRSLQAPHPPARRRVGRRSTNAA